MATFNININAKPINIGDINLYYGTRENIPDTEADVFSLESKLINSTLINIEILTTFNNHILVIPEEINLINIIDIKNSYEEYLENYIKIKNIQITTNEGVKTYEIYQLKTKRKFYNNTIFTLNLNTL